MWCCKSSSIFFFWLNIKSVSLFNLVCEWHSDLHTHCSKIKHWHLPKIDKKGINIILYLCCIFKKSLVNGLPDWDMNNMAYLLQMAFSFAFSSKKTFYALIKILLKFVAEGPIDNKSSIIQVMGSCQTGNKPLLNQWWLSFMKPHGITKPQWAQIKVVIHQMHCSGLNKLIFFNHKFYFLMFSTIMKHFVWRWSNTFNI